VWPGGIVRARQRVFRNKYSHMQSGGAAIPYLGGWECVKGRMKARPCRHSSSRRLASVGPRFQTTNARCVHHRAGKRTVTRIFNWHLSHDRWTRLWKYGSRLFPRLIFHGDDAPYSLLGLREPRRACHPAQDSPIMSVRHAVFPRKLGSWSTRIDNHSEIYLFTMEWMAPHSFLPRRHVAVERPLAPGAALPFT
jgi:hypothetical protein